MITVIINGKEYQLEGPTSLLEYLESTGLSGRRLAVALNSEVLRREEYENATLKNGDRLEIVRPVGGGSA